MSKELEKLFLRNWLPILPYKILALFFFLCTFFYVGSIISYKPSMKEGGVEGSFTVQKISLEENFIRIVGKGKGKYMIEYYPQKEEKLFFQKIEIGDTLWIRGKRKVPPSNTNFHLFNYRNYLKSQNIFWIIEASSIKRKTKNKVLWNTMKNACIKRIEKSPNKAYLYAFILGDTSFLEEEVKDAFRHNGMSHLFAISGMHITFLSFLILKIFSFLPRKGRYFVCFTFLFFYLFLTSFSPSTIRSVLLFGSHLFLKKKNALPFIAALLLWIQPFYIYHLGFIFSFTISFFLSKYKKEKSYIKNLIHISILSFLASIPILLSFSYEVELLSILYNLFFVPFVSVLFFPLCLLTFAFPFLAPFFSILVSFLENISLFCTTFSVSFSFPKASPLFISIYYLFLYFGLSTKNRKYFFLLLFLLCIQYFSSSFRIYSSITMVDVGQGDCILLELKDGSNVLIDTGGKTFYQKDPAYYSVIPYLKVRGIRKIDLLILTHGDVDHMGSAREVIKNFKTDQIILNSGHMNELEKKIFQENSSKVHFMSKGKIKMGENTFYFLNSKSIKSENNDSLIVYTKIEKFHIVFMGDAEKENEKRIKEVYNLGKMDILKVGHHGSKTSTSEEFIKEIKPKYSFISVGKTNRYGHPNEEVLNLLRTYHSKVYRTDEHGMIKATLKKEIEIKTCMHAT